MGKRTISNKRKSRKRNKRNTRTSSQVLVPNRIYKARIFEMVFSQKNELLELYNSMNGSHYQNPDDLQINTLENAIYITMQNDVSFVIDSRLNLYEHQSTYNPNLPLRFLMYASDIFSDYTKDDNLYGSAPVKIPNPHFVVFYNGEKERPDREVMLLSDLFKIPTEEANLELKAIVLNINPGHNTHLLSVCKTLRDFSTYCHLVRTYTEVMPLEEAVEKAITECIANDILADFLRKNRAEAKAVSIYEFDEKKFVRHMKREERISIIETLLETTGFSIDYIFDLLRIPQEERSFLQEKVSIVQNQKESQNIGIHEHNNPNDPGHLVTKEKISSIQALSRNMNISYTDAMNLLSIPSDEQAVLLDEIHSY